MKLTPLAIIMTRRVLVPALTFTTCLSLFGSPEGSAGYVAHEWGTFTSVQDANGELQRWRPLQKVELPDFVYDWYRAGYGRQCTSEFMGFKSDILSLQRMETPVIYFYSPIERKVDVSVRFPEGLITEWYPQAHQIGPSTVRQDYQSACDATTQESRALWAGVQILPSAAKATLKPANGSASHYFTARATEANPLRIPIAGATGLTESEKFIFYRGVGNFSSPLKVSLSATDALTIGNTGEESLRHLFVLSVHDGSASFTSVDQVSGHGSQTVPLRGFRAVNGGKLASTLGTMMKEALINEGLYRAEAESMVNTWADSWFEEDGIRVLYVLPRRWTDTTLPIQMQPAARELVRVMVGRAEVLPPVLTKTLSVEIKAALGGDVAARKTVTIRLKKLGRFAEPAVNVAFADAPSKLKDEACTFVWESRRASR